MTPLQRALTDRIRAEGRMTVEAFMQACNEYYYATRDPLGIEGDFTTAPEMSQMYGEMIGAALADVWARAGRPHNVRYAELGPGRGTLAADALRVLRASGCEPTSVELVETSPTLRAAQRERVPDAVCHDDLGGLSAGDGPLLLVASEFFDALPIRQFVGGFERHVILAAGGLAFDRDGPIVETAPARNDAMEALARLLADKGGAAIVIDYGFGEKDAKGDTLQAMRAHKHTYVLDTPGEQDLTSHVDFPALAEAARRGGAVPSRLISQGSWLETLGIGARAMALAARNPERTEEIANDRRRLCDEAEMGRLFKVLGVRAPGWPDIAGLDA
ncbi:class I SAM-dependent methyltransferase [Sphingomonas jaspsi]|uniref:class I SAM-dependent methyltransferase n=1 Tax=Sphingomonas jaspsi TaxID=392409 RepID=UPI0004AC93C4|nr:SAM-dependent methyltransferase [Sphingomonas jaspsi]